MSDATMVGGFRSGGIHHLAGACPAPITRRLSWSRRPVLLVLGTALLFGSCVVPLPVGDAIPPAYERVDLSHAFDERTIAWPNARGFELRELAYGPTERGHFYAAYEFSMAEHCGTHMDAPLHFAEGQAAVDEVPLSQCLGPAVVVDVRDRCASDPDYRLAVADLEAFEKAHRSIAPGDIVIVFTGWQDRWPDRKRYLGDDTPGDVTHLHFPGIGRDAAEWLAARKVAMVGLDTASLDHGPSRDFIAHQILNGAGIPGLENLTRLDRLPPTGASVIALPMKIRGGSGGPCRVVALVPRENPDAAQR